jgi:hypothetical protein
MEADFTMPSGDAIAGQSSDEWPQYVPANCRAAQRDRHVFPGPASAVPGNFFIWLGIILFPRLWWLTVIFTLMFCLYYGLIMFAEEEFLAARFGRRFQHWAASTPAFFPNFKQWRAPELAFSLRNVLRREYSALCGILTAFAVLELVEHLVIERTLKLDLEWQCLATLGLAQFICSAHSNTTRCGSKSKADDRSLAL